MFGSSSFFYLWSAVCRFAGPGQRNRKRVVRYSARDIVAEFLDTLMLTMSRAINKAFLSLKGSQNVRSSYADQEEGVGC